MSIMSIISEDRRYQNRLKPELSTGFSVSTDILEFSAFILDGEPDDLHYRSGKAI